MSSKELTQQYRDLHNYIIRRVADYGAMVAEETEERDPLKHGLMIAEIAMDIVSKMEDFIIHLHGVRQEKPREN
jgi:hypothetical protein